MVSIGNVIDAIIENHPKSKICREVDDPRLDTIYVQVSPKICVRIHGIYNEMSNLSIVSIPSLDAIDYEELYKYVNINGDEEREEPEELFTLNIIKNKIQHETPVIETTLKQLDNILYVF